MGALAGWRARAARAVLRAGGGGRGRPRAARGGPAPPLHCPRPPPLALLLPPGSTSPDLVVARRRHLPLPPPLHRRRAPLHPPAGRPLPAGPAERRDRAGE